MPLNFTWNVRKAAANLKKHGTSFEEAARTKGDDMKKARKPREPSKASLREIPEVEFHSAKVQPNPYAVLVAAKGIVQVRRGRPKKGTETGPTVPRSIRFPAPVWKLLQQRARSEGLSLHSALRNAVLDWATRAPGRPQAPRPVPR